MSIDSRFTQYQADFSRMDSHRGVRPVLHRHSRPQIPAGSLKEPSKQRLLVESTPSWVSKPADKEGSIHKASAKICKQEKAQIEKVSGWTNYHKLGTLFQGSSEYIVTQDRRMRLAMFRLAESQSAASLAQRLRHNNILAANQLVNDANKVYIGFDYARFTLEEVLNTHLPFNEAQFRTIARSVTSPENTSSATS